MRRAILFAAMFAVEVYPMRISSEDLTVMRVHDDLRVSAPRLHFLSGKPLQRLHDAMAVPFDFQLTLFNGSHDAPYRRSAERFVVSYDIWEEPERAFSVTRMRSPRKTILGLSPASAEAWCLDNLLVSSSGVPANNKLWLRLEIRAEGPHDAAPVLGGDQGISLAGLVELFSRPPGNAQERWAMDTDPFRLAELN